ncbi:MAG: hypothetical protein ACYC5U_06890 [Rhodocyclaceae bacterium]
MGANSLQLAHQIATSDGLELPPGALEWLRAGLRRYLAGQAPLEVALGLGGAARIAARNLALREAARILDDGQNAPPWEIAGALAQAVSHFECCALKRCRAGETHDLSPLQAALWQAFQAGATPRRTRRSLYDLLR